MKSRALYLSTALIFGALTATTVADDWNQWRGPSRNGGDSQSVVLAKIWPKSELPKLWESAEKIPSEMGFGFSSPVIAGGNVFVFIAWKHSEPISSRTLNEQGLRGVGWNPVKLPNELSLKVEAARSSEERAGLKGEALESWVKQWTTENPPDKLSEEQKAEYGNLVTNRLKRGKDALDLTVLEKLATIKGKEFPTPQDLDKWFDENGIAAEVRKPVLDQIPTCVDTTDDTVLCLSGTDGTTLWKTVLKKEPPTPLAFKSWGVSATPCVVDGKVYVNGLDGVYCLEATSGKEVWRNAVGGANSSPCVVDGVLIVQSTTNTKQLRALKASDGKELWVQPKTGCGESSPVVWKDGPDTYLLCNDNQVLSCVSLKEGNILWSVPGSGRSTPALGDGYVVIQGDKPTVGLMAYKLSKETPAKAWSVPISTAGSSPAISNGHVYAEGKEKTVCVELATGKIAWEQKLGVDTYSSPSLVGGVMITTNQGSMTILNADPLEGKVLARLKLPHLRCTSAAIADGKMVVRSKDRIACYDLVNIPAAPEQKLTDAPK